MMLDELLEWAWLVLDFEKPEWRDPLVEHSYQCPVPFFRGGKITAAWGALLCQGSLWDVTCLSWRGDFLSVHCSFAKCPSIPSHHLGLGSAWNTESKECLGLWLKIIHVEGANWMGPGETLWAGPWVLTLGHLWVLGSLWMMGVNSRANVIWFAFPAAPRYCWEKRGC